MIVTVQKRSFIITYLKLGYLLHLITVIELVIIIGCFYYFDLMAWILESYVVIKSFLLLLFVTAPIFPQCDVRSRFQNYKQVKDHLYLYGFQKRIVRPFSYSRCQRDAVIAAAEELGLEKACKQYFFDQGLRWYHLLPEFFYHKPIYFFHRAFWLNTFFAKYYPPKIDFSSLGRNEILKTQNQYHFQAGSVI